MINNKWIPLAHYIPPGWVPLVEKLIETLHAFPFVIEVTQIKEKFGGLRFYYHIAGEHDKVLVDRVYSLVDEAEFASMKICQDCGHAGQHRNVGYWMVVMCAACHEIAEKKRLTSFTS